MTDLYADLYPAPPSVLMAGATMAFVLSWLILSTAARMTGARRVASERTILVVSMISTAMFVIADTALSTQWTDVWNVFLLTNVLMASGVTLVAFALSQVPAMRRPQNEGRNGPW